MFSNDHVLVDFQLVYDERVFPPTNADAPVLEFEFPEECYGTVVDTRKKYLVLVIQMVGTRTTSSEAEKKEDEEAVVDSNTPIKTENAYFGQ